MKENAAMLGNEVIGIEVLEIQKYLIYFFLFSFVGWLIESAFYSLINKKLINRGFFMLPISPIYGFTMTLILSYLYKENINLVILFFGSAVFSIAVEYFVYALLKMAFKVQFWSYEDYGSKIKRRVYWLIFIFWSALIVLYFEFIHSSLDGLLTGLIFNYKVNMISLLPILTTIIVIDGLTTALTVEKLRARLIEMNDIRYKFKSYIEHSNIFGSANELIQKADIRSEETAINAIRDLGFSVITYGEVSEEALAANLSLLKVRYNKLFHLSLYERRLLMAYPNIKYAGYIVCLDDLIDNLNVKKIVNRG